MLVTDETTSSQDETAILHPSSRMLFRFWETMRAERPAPCHADLDLRQIRQLVPFLFISEYVAKSATYRWRLAGTGVCDIYRHELTGHDVLSGWEAFESGTIGRFLSTTIRSFQPAVLRFRMQTDKDQVVGAEMAAFPIVAADGATTHIFGGLFPFRETLSLHYTRLLRFELSAARHIWTENIDFESRARLAVIPPIRNFQVISGGLSKH